MLAFPRGGSMPNNVRIPVQLRALTNGEEVVSASGKSVLELIEDIDKKFPGIKERICEADGKVRRFVNIFVNEEDIRFLEDLQTPISDKDEVSIIPAIAGG
jgi:sulfur-carrier protein